MRGCMRGGVIRSFPQVRLGRDDPRDPKMGHPSPDGLTWVVEPKCAHAAGVWHDSEARRARVRTRFQTRFQTRFRTQR
jgi:hypothetical protein